MTKLYHFNEKVFVVDTPRGKRHMTESQQLAEALKWGELEMVSPAYLEFLRSHTAFVSVQQYASLVPLPNEIGCIGNRRFGVIRE